MLQRRFEKAQQWVDKTYKNLSQDEKLGQLFIVAFIPIKVKTISIR
jgi:hypothetical protein